MDGIAGHEMAAEGVKSSSSMIGGEVCGKVSVLGFLAGWKVWPGARLFRRCPFGHQKPRCLFMSSRSKTGLYLMP